MINKSAIIDELSQQWQILKFPKIVVVTTTNYFKNPISSAMFRLAIQAAIAVVNKKHF